MNNKTNIYVGGLPKQKHRYNSMMHKPKTTTSGPRKGLREQVLSREMQRVSRAQKNQGPEKIKTLIDQETQNMEITGAGMSKPAVQEIREWLENDPQALEDKNKVSSTFQTNFCDRVTRNFNRPRERRPRLSGVLFKGLDPIPVDPNVDPPQRCCYNCWNPGHKRRHCPEPPTDDRYCINCGRRDVWMSICPRCSRACRVMKWIRKSPLDEPDPDVPTQVLKYFENEELWDNELNRTHYNVEYMFEDEDWDYELAHLTSEEIELLQDETNFDFYEIEDGNENWDDDDDDDAPRIHHSWVDNNYETFYNKRKQDDQVFKSDSALYTMADQLTPKNLISSQVQNPDFDSDAFSRRLKIIIEQLKHLNEYTSHLSPKTRDDVYRYIFQVPKDSDGR